jgi:hypothetical protein
MIIHNYLINLILKLPNQKAMFAPRDHDNRIMRVVLGTRLMKWVIYQTPQVFYGLFFGSLFSNSEPTRNGPYWTSRVKGLELIELSRKN